MIVFFLYICECVCRWCPSSHCACCTHFRPCVAIFSRGFYGAAPYRGSLLLFFFSLYSFSFLSSSFTSFISALAPFFPLVPLFSVGAVRLSSLAFRNLFLWRRFPSREAVFRSYLFIKEFCTLLVSFSCMNIFLLRCYYYFLVVLCTGEYSRIIVLELSYFCLCFFYDCLGSENAFTIVWFRFRGNWFVCFFNSYWLVCLYLLFTFRLSAIVKTYLILFYSVIFFFLLFINFPYSLYSSYLLPPPSPFVIYLSMLSQNLKVITGYRLSYQKYFKCEAIIQEIGKKCPTWWRKE